MLIRLVYIKSKFIKCLILMIQVAFSKNLIQLIDKQLLLMLFNKLYLTFEYVFLKFISNNFFLVQIIRFFITLFYFIIKKLFWIEIKLIQ